ncbi:MAG TPA: bifunctional alpha,alpha-trehalose-phosphate synthase (UDP-forming)/trehalose-phosphatase [Bacteroidales bacterium]|nr:bifunctional alpha,alpha-trehalose-phosphate synthase (UDP-forming)/trehalose-phosphatase [Bacteroidales bacterium]
MIQPTKNNFKRIVIVAYRLPFKFVQKGGKMHAIQNAGGLVSAILSLSDKMHDVNYGNIHEKTVWIGKSDNSPKEFGAGPIENEIFDIEPVFIPDSINDKFYGGFCNDLVWPLFHYFPSLAVFDNSYYDSYQKANLLFYEALKKVIQPGDFIWVHDYQLFFLPALIRKDFPKANISFFLHIPFPSYEVFRILPREWRNEVLKGLLGADLIGFHTNDYSQYFIKSVRRCLGYETSLNIIYAEGRTVKSDAFPIGIDYNKFNETVGVTETAKYATRLNKQKRNLQLIFSVDRLDYTKGFLQRLAGYEEFLERHKSMHGKVIFNMVIVPSRDTIVRYQDMKKEIEATVGRINGKFNTLEWRPISYQYKSLKFNEMVALYNISDVALITPIRDGMNLVAKEFVACQTENPGVLILSEMAGASVELSEAILVNPTDRAEVSEAIFKALTMPHEERAQRMEKMQQQIKNYDVFSWANDILNNMQKTKIEQEVFKVKFFNAVIEKEIVQAYKAAKSAILFFDYDGTLVPIRPRPELAIPEKQTLELTEKLAKTTNVVIVSGRDKVFLEKWFSKLPVSVIAEHGAFIKSSEGEWQQVNDTDTSWKEKINPILQRYVNRCKGAFIEEKDSSLCWHYRNAEPDLAFLRTIELREELTEVISNNLPLQILEGHKVIEIKRAGYSKGTAALRMINNRDFDFILAIGDDKTDEELFAALPSNAYTMKVGKAPTVARYNFQKQTEVIGFLNCLLSCE